MNNPTNPFNDCEGEPRRLGFFLPFLAIPVGIALMMGVAKHQRRRMRAHFQREWTNGVPPWFAELHRRAHEAPPAGPGTVA